MAALFAPHSVQSNAYKSACRWTYGRYLDPDLRDDLQIVAQTEIWRKSQSCENPSYKYLLKSATGAMQNWLRDHYGHVHIPAKKQENGYPAIPVAKMGLLIEIDPDSACVENSALSNVVATRIMQGTAALCEPKQMMVLNMLLQGLTVKEVARRTRSKLAITYWRLEVAKKAVKIMAEREGLKI